MTEDEISSLLSDLASIDTHDINLRDHPDAYAAVETALAPLLQDLAAHEASNRIKTENLETLREQNAKLREALVAMAHYGECTVSAFSSGRPYLDMTLLPRLCFDARAALGESE